MRDTGVNQDTGMVPGKAAPGGDKRFPQKAVKGHAAASSEVPATPVPDKAKPSDKPSTDGVISSGGGSFDQK